MTTEDQHEQVLAHINTYSRPSELRITDLGCVDIIGAPMYCTLLKIFTNQGLVGFWEDTSAWDDETSNDRHWS